jgi:hypothetical protein
MATVQQQYAPRLGQAVMGGGAAGGIPDLSQQSNQLGGEKPKGGSTENKARQRTADASAPV